jgi:hypothetical protein
MEKIMIKRIELREYQLQSNDINNCNDDYDVEYNSRREKIRQQKQQQSTNNYVTVYSIILYVDTDQGEIEIDYLGKLTKDKDKFDECFNFLCNYQGISSTLNRVILEIKNNIL